MRNAIGIIIPYKGTKLLYILQKSFVTILLIIFSLCNTYSQKILKDSTVHFDMSVNKFNVLYHGIDSILPKKITITPIQGKIIKKNGIYIYRDSLASIQFDINFEFSNGKTIKKSRFFSIIDTLPIPIISRIAYNYINKTDIAKYPYIEIFKQDSILSDINVISYCIASYNSCGRDKAFFSRRCYDGNQLTNIALQVLECANIFDNVYIENINAKDKNGKIIYYPPIIFRAIVWSWNFTKP